MLDQEFDISRVVLLQARAAVTFISVCQHTNAGEALIHTHTHTLSLSLLRWPLSERPPPQECR